MAALMDAVATPVPVNTVLKCYFKRLTPADQLSRLSSQNVRSLDNNLDYLRLQLTIQHEMKDYCVFIFVEMWLH